MHGTKKELLARFGRLIERYVPSAKARNAQWAYEGRYLFYNVCQEFFLRGSAILSLL